MTKGRPSFAELAAQAPEPMPATVPVVRHGTGTRSVRVSQIAANPLNTRDMARHEQGIESLAKSLKLKGQLESCAVVSRSAFLAVFREHELTIGTADYVQVTGGRRLMAARRAGLHTLDVTEKDALVATRLDFLIATAEENIEREDLDPVEEAEAIKLMVAEVGNQARVAEKMGRSAAWVRQRLDLLKLVPQLQELLRDGMMPIRVARAVALAPEAEQVPMWESMSEGREPAPDEPEPGADGDTPAPRPRLVDPSAVKIRAVRKLGKTTPEIAQSLVATMDRAQAVELTDELFRLLDASAS